MFWRDIPFLFCVLKACVECLLGSGNKENIKHAEHLLSSRPEDSQRIDRVNYQRSVELVVKSAREYFNSANDVKDPCMKLAKWVVFGYVFIFL
jgi:hypothetical protein